MQRLRFEEMTEDQKWELIEQMEEKCRSEDLEEFKEMTLALNKNVSDEARRIHKESIVIDACTFNVIKYGWRLEAAGCTALNCTVPGINDDAGGAFKSIWDYYQVINSDNRFRLILKPDDILEAKKNGQTGLIIGAQNNDFVRHHDMRSSLQAFHTLGLRVMQIAYNHRTFAADGCFSPANAGLSDTGIELIRLMEEFGITVDLSHVGWRSAEESLEMAQKPQIYSHSNPYALFQHPRNITDDQAKKCAATGGCIGVSAYPVTLYNGDKFPSIDEYVDCIEYYCNLVGVDHVGIGMDTTATEGAYPRWEIAYFNKVVRRTVGEDAVTYKSLANNRGYLAYKLEGLICLANFVKLIDHMLKRGFREPDIKKILGENWLRVFRDTWK